MAIKKMVSEDAVVPETLRGETVKVATIGGKSINAPIPHSKGVRDDGSPADDELHGFFTESNGVLTNRVNDLIGTAVGDVNAVLASALDGTEVA